MSQETQRQILDTLREIRDGQREIIAALAAALMLVHAGVSVAAGADPDRRTERVRFAAGATSTVIKGEIRGRQYVDYRLRAGAGQTLSVTLEASNLSNHFNVNPPGSEAAMFIGSTSGGRFERMLPADGEYTVRVYLMRAAGRRNESSRYTLTIGVTGKPLAALPASVDALIPGTPYHASAPVPCAHSLDPEARQCEAFVIRRGRDGTATVEVRWPGGMKRRVLFLEGKPAASDSPEPLSASRKGDNTLLGTGAGEQAEIPDALLTGG